MDKKAFEETTISIWHRNGRTLSGLPDSAKVYRNGMLMNTKDKFEHLCIVIRERKVKNK